MPKTGLVVVLPLHLEKSWADQRRTGPDNPLTVPEHLEGTTQKNTGEENLEEEQRGGGQATKVRGASETFCPVTADLASCSSSQWGMAEATKKRPSAV